MKTLNLSELVNNKPGIVRGSGLSRQKVVTVITAFFRFVMIYALKGYIVQLPFESTIGIYKYTMKGKKLPPLKRSRFKGKAEYPEMRRGMKTEYKIVADAGPKYNKTVDVSNHKIKIEASSKFREVLVKILNNSKQEYTVSPWQ